MSVCGSVYRSGRGVCDFVSVGSKRRGVLWEGVRGVKSDRVCVEGIVLCVSVGV